MDARAEAGDVAGNQELTSLPRVVERILGLRTLCGSVLWLKILFFSSSPGEDIYMPWWLLFSELVWLFDFTLWKEFWGERFWQSDAAFLKRYNPIWNIKLTAKMLGALHALFCLAYSMLMDVPEWYPWAAIWAGYSALAFSADVGFCGFLARRLSALETHAATAGVP